MRAGHSGLFIIDNDEIVAMGWWITNSEDTPRRVKKYFMLPSGHSYFHADWTAPSHRGRGYHRALIALRAQEVIADSPNAVLLANIEPSNGGSIRNYARSGFRRDSIMNVRRLGPFLWTRAQEATTL